MLKAERGICQGIELFLVRVRRGREEGYPVGYRASEPDGEQSFGSGVRDRASGWGGGN